MAIERPYTQISGIDGKIVVYSHGVSELAERHKTGLPSKMAMQQAKGRQLSGGELKALQDLQEQQRSAAKR